MELQTIPYIDYVREDKSKYPLANEKGYYDPDCDYRIGDSGGFLMNIEFTFYNTQKFSEVSDSFTKHGTYCLYPKGTKQYNDFWITETKRRREGLTLNCKLYFKDIPGYTYCVTNEQKASTIKDFIALLDTLTETETKRYLNPLRITGDHYNYLNYGRITRTRSDEEKADETSRFSKAKKVEGFPRFWDGDYWNFKADEFVSFNELNLCKGKARRKGYSFKRGSQGANTMNLTPKITIVLAAFDSKFLTSPGKTTDMLKTNLDWYEHNTYWRRSFLSEDLDAIELGYKMSNTGNSKYGYRSKALSLTLRNNPGAPIGTDISEIDYEESGRNPVLQKSLNLVRSAAEAGGIKTGIIRVYGTGGEEDADWRDFCAIFYNPKGNGMMPFENIYDNNARHELCGFFHPQILNYEPYVDKHGNSDLEKSLEADNIEKKNAESNLGISDYIIYVGQRANSPSEAFKRGSENIFSSPDLDNYIIKLESDKDLHYWRDGELIEDESKVIFKTNAQLLAEGTKIHQYITSVPFTGKEDVQGCTREFYPPFVTNGSVPDDLYYILYDPIGKDKKLKELSIKNSLASIQVWMYPNNISNSPGDILVASYTGRRDEMKDIDRICLKLCKYYNAKALVEVDRGDTVNNFRLWQELRWLYKDPTSIIGENSKDNTNSNYGILIGTGSKAEDGLIYLKDFLYEPVAINSTTDAKVYQFQYIRDISFLKELQQYNSNHNFDRVSCARLMPFQRKAYKVKRTKARLVQRGTMLQDIGLYGYKG